MELNFLEVALDNATEILAVCQDLEAGPLNNQVIEDFLGVMDDLDTVLVNEMILEAAHRGPAPVSLKDSDKVIAEAEKIHGYIEATANKLDALYVRWRDETDKTLQRKRAHTFRYWVPDFCLRVEQLVTIYRHLYPEPIVGGGFMPPGPVVSNQQILDKLDEILAILKK